MIRKRSNNTGINANISLEPQAASQSTSNINNNIIINKREDGKEDIVITRDLQLPDPPKDPPKDVRNIILETYAQILLNQDKALLANLISKNCIIVPATSLAEIIKAITRAEIVEINLNEDVGCLNKSPIRKIETIKIVNDNGEVCIDFKQIYNKEYNELVNKYHLCLKYGINQ